MIAGADGLHARVSSFHGYRHDFILPASIPGCDLMDFQVPILAAIRAEKNEPADDVLRAVFDRLTSEGFRVVGSLQQERPAVADCCGRLELEDLGSGARLTISQALGTGARGCRLDPQALAALAGPLQARLQQGDLDFLILNRFGKTEAEGRGLREAIETACLAGIPVLCVVRPAYVEAWSSFAGDFGILLPPMASVALDWARNVLTA